MWLWLSTRRSGNCWVLHKGSSTGTWCWRIIATWSPWVRPSWFRSQSLPVGILNVCVAANVFSSSDCPYFVVKVCVCVSVYVCNEWQCISRPLSRLPLQIWEELFLFKPRAWPAFDPGYSALAHSFSFSPSGWYSFPISALPFWVYDIFCTGLEFCCSS